MKVEQARSIFYWLMEAAKRRRLKPLERHVLGVVRQALRRAKRPAMNPGDGDLFAAAGIPLEFTEGESRPRLARSSKEAARMLGRGRRPELLREGRQFDESRLEESPLFRGHGRQRLLENRAGTLEEATEARIAQIYDAMVSGPSEMTGKARREYGHEGAFVGRFGGVKPAFRELRHVGAGPKQIGAAIARGKGKVFTQVYEAAREEMEREGFKPARARARSRGRLTVAPHKRLRRYCLHCRSFHAKGEHRFHGAGSFHRTHLFSFNKKKKARSNPSGRAVGAVRGRRIGRIVEIRYERDFGRKPGYYKHVFRVPASVYCMPDKSVRVR